MQKPSELHNFTSDNNVKFKKPVHDPFKFTLCYAVSRLTQKQGSSQLFFFPQPFVHGGFILTVLSQYIILKQWMQLKQALPELLIQTNQSSSNLQHNPHYDSIINTENIHNKTFNLISRRSLSRGALCALLSCKYSSLYGFTSAPQWSLAWH